MPARLRPLILLPVVLLAATPAAAAPDAAEADRCDRAVAAAAARHGVPETLLRALSHIESGRRVDGARRPWPWTVNAAGEGRWFDTRAEALAFIRAKSAAGVRSIDIGCLQLNAIWHGKAFSGLAEMLDPEANVDYAARYLASLQRETGNWMRAAGFYHSRTPKHFDRYSALVRTAYANLKERAADLLAPKTPAPAPVVVAALAPPRLRPAPEEIQAAAEEATAPSAFKPVWRGLLRQSAALLWARPKRPLLSAAPAPATTPHETGRRGRGGVALAFAGGAKPLIAPETAPRPIWSKP